MTLAIRGTFEFADYESGGGGVQKQKLIINTFLNLLSFFNIINWLYYKSLLIGIYYIIKSQ